MSLHARKVHFESPTGLVWCQPGRTSPQMARSPRPEEVTCQRCRPGLDEYARQQAQEREGALRAAVEALR